ACCDRPSSSRRSLLLSLNVARHGRPVALPLAGDSRRPQPHGGVVERAAALGRTRLGADQRVDAEALLEGAVGPDAFDHDHAALQAFERTGMHDDGGLPAADAHARALGNAEPRAVVGMDERRGPALALL